MNFLFILMEDSQFSNNNQGSSAGNAQDANSDTVMKILCYLGILCLIPYLVVKNDDFIKFHAKQGVVLLLLEVATAMFAVIPILGWMIAPIVYLCLFVLAILGIMNAIGGKKVALPIIGNFAKNF